MSDVGAIGRAGFDQDRRNSGGDPGKQGEPSRAAPRRRFDAVELTAPAQAALRLLRERVLDSTRQALELPRPGSCAIHFAEPPLQRTEAFLGRLLSDQNLLAAPRRGRWPDARIDACLVGAMNRGVEQTLGVLHDLDALDETTWRLVVEVLDEFERKVSGGAAAGPAARRD
jgi:hypothetical protein